MHEVVFLKLGGSLITNKNQRYSPRLDKLNALAGEIHSALMETPDLRLVLGHGSGSFGHFAVQEHLAPEAFGSPDGSGADSNQGYWRGFAEVWYRASELNRHVMEALHLAGVPGIAVPPSATVRASGGTIVEWDLTAVDTSIQSGLVPVIFGDIVFDATTGGTVLSTEKLMMYLARRMQPRRILLAGLEEAVWADFPQRLAPISRITPGSYPAVASQIGGSEGTDVTGGMRGKVEEMLALVKEIPDLTVYIFSGEDPGNLRMALAHSPGGTVIAGD
jgi:isopentenyl phosphate kinase